MIVLTHAKHSCVNLLPPPDDVAFLQTAHGIYVKHQRFPEALALSIRLGDPSLIRSDFTAVGNPLMKRQLAFLLARAQVPKEWLEPEEGAEEELPEDLLDCLNNTRLSQHFKDFGKELGVLEAKSLEDVYKSHLENTSTLFCLNYVNICRGRLIDVTNRINVHCRFSEGELGRYIRQCIRERRFRK